MDSRIRKGMARGGMVFLLLWIGATGWGSASGQEDKPVQAAKEKSELVLTIKGEDSGGKAGPIAGLEVIVCDSQDVLHRQKTSKQGSVVLKDLPRGTVRVQVVAPAWEPFGKDYDLTQNKHEFSIELKARQSK